MCFSLGSSHGCFCSCRVSGFHLLPTTIYERHISVKVLQNDGPGRDATWL